MKTKTKNDDLFGEVFHAFFFLLIGAFFLVLFGCLPIPGEDIRPELGLRMLEGKYGTWYLLKVGKSENPNGLAVRLEAPNPLYFFQEKYQFYCSGKTHIIASNSIPKRLHHLVFERGGNVDDFSTKRTFIKRESGEEITSFGGFLNVDKIFSENSWCKYILVDDLDAGMLFTRNKKEFVFTSFDRMKLRQCKVVERARSYRKIVNSKPFCNSDTLEKL